MMLEFLSTLSNFFRVKKVVPTSLFSFIIFPVLFYFSLFLFFIYPALLHFSTHFYTDNGDGLQSVWDIWWVNESVTKLHQLPWYTNYLFYPDGITLISHTLSPFNGLFAILFLRIFTLTQTFNILFIFSFVSTGIFTFYTAYLLSKSYIGSLLAGCIFTFSSYHFAHAQGHLNLISLEWIPVFMYFWYKMLIKPQKTTAFFAGLSIFMTLLCDFHYFFYCTVIAILLSSYLYDYRVNVRKYKNMYIQSFLVYFITFLITSGPLPLAFIKTYLSSHLIGGQNPFDYSVDITSLIIPGGHWRFASLTRSYWVNLPGNINENSVFLPISVIIILFYTVILRKKIKKNILMSLYLVLVLFFIMSLGPTLQIYKINTYILLPYYYLTSAFPLLQLSGDPIRMTSIVIFISSLIFAIGFGLLLSQKKIIYTYIGVFLILFLFIQLLPSNIPLTRIQTPAYITFLSHLPNDGGIIDTTTSAVKQMYFQTIDTKKTIDGYLARYPLQALNKRNMLYDLSFKKNLKNSIFT